MGQLQWLPTDSFSVLYTYDATRIDEIPEAPWVTNANPASATGRNLAPYDQSEDDRPDNIQINGIGIAETEVDGQSLDIRWELADSATLQSLTGYREMSNNSVADSDGSPLTVLSTRDIQSNEALSQEFRLFGTSGRLDYSAGAFYMDEEGDVYQEQIVFGGSSGAIADYKNEAWAAYGQGTFAFTDKLDLTVGARYTEESREMGKASYAGRSFNPAPTLDAIKAAAPLTGVTIFPQAAKDYSNVSWLVSLGYNWTDDVLTYAKVSTGFQSGGFNARDGNPVDFVTGFKEETLLAYELGLKSRWANRFQVNAAAFFSDYDDKRVNQFNQQTLASVQKNAGVVEIWGVEIEVLAQLTDGLQAGLNYGYVNHEYVEYLNTQNGVTTDLSKVSNFPYSPENTASAFVAYEYPLNFGTLRARLDYSYRDEMTFLVPQPERNSSEGAEILNARITLQEIKGPGDSNMRVSLWGKNLTDESYWNFGVNIYSSFGFDINTYGEPRTYGVELEIDF
jgi:iron complex outermembrane receptor protein